jgi:Tfp pilus assembly major pilin PilA
MVVIVIIGVLGSVALPKFKRAVENSRAKELQQVWKPGRNMANTITPKNSINQDRTPVNTVDSVSTKLDTVKSIDTKLDTIVIHDTIKITDTIFPDIKTVEVIDINGVSNVLIPFKGKYKAIPIKTTN